jgi:hemerythrin-like domain-containing protein
MKCTELLNQDHVILRRGLDILDGMVRKLEDGQRIETADVRAILKFLRILEDGEERVLVVAMEEALESKRGRDFARSSRQLTSLLRNHLDKKDTVVRDIVKQSLSTEIYSNFARLERKYARPPHETSIKLHA